MSDSLGRKSGETELQFIWRIGQAKEAGLIDKTWSELADILNKELRDDPSEFFSESAYRKKYAAMKQGFDEVFKYQIENDRGLSDEIVTLRRELEKEKIKLRDERTAYNKQIREEARKESYAEQFITALENFCGQHPLQYKESRRLQDVLNSNTSMIVSLTDIHAGLEINNIFNQYDVDVLRQQLKYYLNRIFEIQARHHCENVYLIISETLSGIIHPTIRMQNNQDLIEQFIIVTDYLCDFISELCYKFDSVNVYVAPGNHSRINPRKEDSLAHENMDNLLIPFIRAKMQNFDNVHCYDNNPGCDVAMFTVRGLKVCAVHGDKDTPKTVTGAFTKMFREKPDIIWMCHRHFNEYTTDSDSKVIQSGCFCGSDEYALSNRLRNKAEQIVAVIDDDYGLDCIYDIQV